MIKLSKEQIALLPVTTSNDKNLIWRKIPNYNLYEINNLGEIRRVPSIIISSTGRRYIQKGRILKIKANKDGYKCVSLCENGIQKGYFVHNLLAKVFIPNPNNYPIVNHKDKNPSNNSLDNLEWCDYRYNANYSIEEIYKAHEKEQIPIIGINVITKTFKKYKGLHEAERDTKVHHSNISYAIRNNTIAGNHYWINYVDNFDINDFIKEKGLTYPNKTVKLI